MLLFCTVLRYSSSHIQNNFTVIVLEFTGANVLNLVEIVELACFRDIIMHLARK